MPFVRTARFEAFVAPARERSALWRLAAGLALAAFAWTLAVLFAALLQHRLGAGPRAGLLLYLASFAGLALGTAAAARLLHGRAVATLLGPGGFRPRGFGLAVAAVAALALFTTTASLALAPPTRQVDLADWARFLPLAVPLIFVQTAAEELFFRGYLTQALAARFRSPLAWALLPSIAFGALHWDGALGRDAWLGVAAATAVGLALADVAARTGNVSAAMGLHFANNLAALLLVGMPGPTGVLALAVAPVDAPHPLGLWLVADIASTLAAWTLWRLALARIDRHAPGGSAGRLQSRDRGSI